MLAFILAGIRAVCSESSDAVGAVMQLRPCHHQVSSRE